MSSLYDTYLRPTTAHERKIIEAVKNGAELKVQKVISPGGWTVMVPVLIMKK